MPTSYEVTRKPGEKKKEDKKKNRVTSEDVPGSGMAKKAAKAIEARRAKRKELLNNI